MGYQGRKRIQTPDGQSPNVGETLPFEATANGLSFDNCRLCGSNGLQLALQLENAPTNVSRLLRPEQLVYDRPVVVRAYECEKCGFVQLRETLETDFYDDYLMTVSHSPQMHSLQEQQASSFVERFSLSGLKVVEVGCGDGHFLEQLQAVGADVVGVEPSRPFRELAERRGFTCHPTTVGTKSRIPDGPFAGFVTRQVLEHVPDPKDFLLGIRSSLTQDGVGLIEVPSLEQSLDQGRFYDFFPDHLNYFCDRTLRFALEMSGFIVEEVSRAMNGEYNVAHVRVDSRPGIMGLQQTVTDLTCDLREFFAECQKLGRRVALWGAGGKGVTASAVAGVPDVAYVVDSDPHKHGLYTPGAQFEVVPPQRLTEDPVDAIIITALAYRDEIVQQLRNELQFNGTIAVLGPRLDVLAKAA